MAQVQQQPASALVWTSGETEMVEVGRVPALELSLTARVMKHASEVLPTKELQRSA
jgi:hypothetical protein